MPQKHYVAVNQNRGTNCGMQKRTNFTDVNIRRHPPKFYYYSFSMIMVI